MWDMRCASNGCCGLSKGTQSDGLISDTSTEELTSSSSTENLKDDKISKKLHAKQSKAAINEFQNSTDLMIQASTSLHRTQTQYQLYIQWGVLLSFGVLLWVALWVTDIFNPNPFLKEGWLADVATAKKVTLKTGIVKKPAPPVWWFQNLWNHTLNSLISVTTLDSAVFLTCITILVYLESHTRNNWRGTLVRLYCNRAEQGETDRSSFHSNISQEDVRSKESDFLSHDDNLSQFSHGDVRNLNQHNNIRGKSEMDEKSTQCLRQEETSTTENRVLKSVKDSRNWNNTRRRLIQMNDCKNCCNLSQTSSQLSKDVVKRELVFKKPSWTCVSSVTKNDQRKSNLEQPSLSCSIFNKSTSFMSEKVETWFELKNSDQAEKVMHTFDAELEEFFKTRNSPSPLSFGEATQDLQQYNSNSIGCECDKQSRSIILNVAYNGGIVSSSPAFRRFLVNLAKDRLSESY